MGLKLRGPSPRGRFEFNEYLSQLGRLDVVYCPCLENSTLPVVVNE